LTKPGDVPIAGQHMLQEAVDKRFGGERAQLWLACRRDWQGEKIILA